MALTPGNRLGPYEIVAGLGAGGMGEVFRARDIKLNRDVAIKVLPDSFASDPERLARFTREAQTLASLNHPHIAQIYGLEESGGVRALVMELVEGEDLSQRIARGAMPLAETLPIAKQIAAALEAAHEQGIIHRDLKPANIKVRPDGTVKVLDFGLAKAMEPAGAMSASVSMSPTITTPAMTQAGMILGTAAYMAPEQARGRPADKRVDIWAFGSVLYEMLTGRRAFDGDDTATVLASVIKGEPDWAALPADVSMPIITLLHRCLQKEPRNRIADIGVASFVLNHAAHLVERVDHPVAASPPAEVQRRQRWSHAAWMAAAVSISAPLAGAGVWLLTRPASPPVVRTTVTTSGSAALMVNRTDRDVAITPDGSRIVYRGNNQLLVRGLNRLEPTVLSGLGAPQGVFVSPDGQWVGFVDGATMKKVAITGGPPETVCAIGGGPRGAAWGKDGTIIFATGAPTIGLQRVSAAGGEPAVLTKPNREQDEGDHLWPEFLPESDAVLFTITPANGSIENSQIAVLDLRTGTSKVLIRGGSHAYYIPTGHLLYSGAGMLRAVPFDLGRREVVGTPAPVLEGVFTTPVGTADMAVAANGSLVYVQGAVGGMKQNVVSVDRQGRASALPGLTPDTWRDVRVSPNGARVALATQNDIWIYDFARANSSRLTTDPGRDQSPLWTRDGQRIIFTSMRAGYRELLWRPSDGSGSDERLLTPGKELVDLLANGWSADGRLLFTEVPANLQNVIGQIAIERPSEVTVLVKNGFSNNNAAVSPDGHWVAYDSNVSGRQEIYVERYPELGQRQQVSRGGGRLPLWSPNGRELFFSSLDGRQMLAVPVPSGPMPVAEQPQVLFEFAMAVPSGGQRPYDLGPDGRFLIIRSDQADAADGAGSNLIVVQNWFEELKRLVPTH